MLQRCCVMLALLGASMTIHAASFDCAKAGTAIEKRICGQPKLSGLDEQLGEKYQAALELLRRNDPDGAELKEFLAEQRRWLKEVRNACTTDKCLTDAYQGRIQVVDPFSDGVLSCAEMQRHPTLAFFEGNVDLGSGSGSPLDVDYLRH
jgi:uncharacterized protein